MRLASVLPKNACTYFKYSVARVSKFLHIDQASRVRLAEFKGFTIAFRTGTADEGVLTESFEQDLLFSGVPEYVPKETDVIMDVGAHIGAFTILAASKAKCGKIYAIEACEDNYTFLRINSQLNSPANVVAVRMALLDRVGECVLHYDAGTWGHSVVSRFSSHGERVPCTTLERFLADHQIEHCDFAKFNCEGAEFPILLSSGPNVLRRIRKMLVLYHCDLWNKNSEEDLIKHLSDAGFECKIRERTGLRGWIVARLAAATKIENTRWLEGS